MLKIQKNHLTTFRIIVTGFGILILLGTFLLTLPVSSRQKGCISVADSLFTAVSAGCVTGLIVQDTASCWSNFGQVVILVLIQIGGLGVVTVTSLLAYISGRKIHMLQRSTLAESISGPSAGSAMDLTRFIVKLTLASEAIGAVLLAPVFCRDFGIRRGIWYAVFHSISAFCNAGFDLMGIREPYSSMTSYRTNLPVNFVLMLLILASGLGFLVWDDVKEHGLKIRRYRLQSRIILNTTILLFTIPSLLFFFFEFNDKPLGERILLSLFQTVTARTAGFNTANFSAMSEAGRLQMIVLMLIGGGPGSTAGGMKTTTFAVLLMACMSVLQQKEDVVAFGRRVAGTTVRRALSIAVIYIFLFISSGCFISRFERLPLMDCLFETASAIATVGVSTGITPRLSMLSRGILIFLMFFGRVGALTLIFATSRRKPPKNAKYPLESVTVG